METTGAPGLETEDCRAGAFPEPERFRSILLLVFWVLDAGEEAAGFSITGLKRGRDRFPHPGILSTQPVETSTSNTNKADNSEMLLKVSRNWVFLGVLCEKPRDTS